MAKIKLTVAGQEFDLITLYYQFSIDVDRKGRPESPMRNGLLFMAMEPTDNLYFFRQFYTEELNTKPFAGKIEAFLYRDEAAVRCLQWKEAYIIKMKESMEAYTNESMVNQIVISPIDLVIDYRTYLTRHIEKTGGWWKIDPTPGIAPMQSPVYQKPESVDVTKEEEEEHECTLKFRRTSDYKGNFGFDWVREGDTSDGYKNPWYCDAVMSKEVYNRYLGEYKCFDQPWRENYSQWKPTRLYYVPWMTILPDETAELRMKLEVGKSSGVMELKVTGCAAGVISLSTESVDANTTGTYYNGTLGIACSGEFGSDSAIEAWNHGELVGKINLVPNDSSRVKHIKIAIVPTEIARYYNPDEVEDTTPAIIPDDMEEVITTLLKQIYVIPEFVRNIQPLDLSEPRSKNNWQGKKGVHVPLFDQYFRQPREKEVIIEGRTVLSVEEQRYRGLNAFQLLDKLYLEANPTVNEKEWSNIYKFYAINFKGFNSMTGQSEFSRKTTLLLGNGINGNTAVHEIGHLFGLPHPFVGHAKEKPIYLHKGQKLTENMMDYTEKRISFMKYQWERLKIE